MKEKDKIDKRSRKYKEKVRSYTALIIVILLILLIIFMSGCSNETFKSYHEVTAYCYNQTYMEECGIEKCIMLNSAEFNDNIKFSAEKNYYQCKLLNCNKGDINGE